MISPADLYLSVGPRVFRTDYGHAEVQSVFANDPREYCISTTDFVKDEEGNLKGLNTTKVEWTNAGGKWKMEKVAGSEKVSHGLYYIDDNRRTHVLLL